MMNDLGGASDLLGFGISLAPFLALGAMKGRLLNPSLIRIPPSDLPSPLRLAGGDFLGQVVPFGVGGLEGGLGLAEAVDD